MSAAFEPTFDRIRAWNGAPDPRPLLVTGAPGTGKSFLVRAALGSGSSVRFLTPGLTDAEHRALFRRGLLGDGGPPPEEGTWRALFGAALSRPGRLVIVDGLAGLLRESRSFLDELGAAWQDPGRAPETRLILIDPDRRMLGRVNARGSAFRDRMEEATGSSRPPAELLEVEPLPWTRVARATGLDADRVLRLTLLFGGRPGVLARIDPEAAPEVSFTSAVLDPGGPLWDEPLRTWRSLIKHPGRYGAVCRALASGARTWAEIPEHAETQIAAAGIGPYLKRLTDLGRVTSAHSLDAPRRSRGRRYALADPFDALWWAAVLPHRSTLATGGEAGAEVWRRIEEEASPTHVRRVLPRLCRSALSERADVVFGSPARQVGALWGDGYEIQVAGTLRNGAIVYGACHGGPRPMTDVGLDRLEEQMRRTRYGFGREARIRALFSLSGFSEALRLRASRDPWIRLLGPEEMLGG